MEEDCNNNRRDGEEKVEGDPETWEALDTNLRQVQTVLDRNRVLIQQVNENHQSRISENMVNNVELIQEINDNVSRVVKMYSDLSDDFSRALSKNGAAASKKRHRSS